jgi:hypothetical protein
MTPLYKYISDPDALRFLLRGIVKFTPISELNDPSELVPNVVIEELRASLARLRQDGFTEEDMADLRRQGNLFRRLAPRFQVIDVPLTKEAATATIRSSFYDQTAELERRLSETAREMSSKVGLFCLSRRYDSLPMWAHYAGNAAGLVVEFSGLDRVFRGDDTGILCQLVDVRYEREQLGVTFDPRSHESLFVAKFHDWSYEQEVRVVLPLADCRQVMVSGRAVYVYEIPSTSVARVILGWKLAPHRVDTIRGYVRAHNPEVELVKAYWAGGRVELRHF